MAFHPNILYYVFLKNGHFQEFRGGPEVRTLSFHCRGRVQSLVGELRSHRSHTMAIKGKKKGHFLI